MSTLTQYEWSWVVARAWVDSEYRSRLIARPEAGLAEAGIRTPDGVTVGVTEMASFSGAITVDGTGSTNRPHIDLILPTPPIGFDGTVHTSFYSRSPGSTPSTTYEEYGTLWELIAKSLSRHTPKP